jgi:DNA-binding beta-propeller fold protein YncE
MKPDRLRSTARNRKSLPWHLILVLTMSVLFPHLSFGADLEVSFDEVTPLGGSGADGREFLPGDEVPVRVRLHVLQATGNPFYVRLRITGDGWRDMLSSEWMGPQMTYGGLQVPATAAPGKVSLLMDVFSPQDTVALHGRRHAYLNVRCPPGIPEEVLPRLLVGTPPRDMALTADGRYLYVTRDVRRDLLSEDPKITVIDVEKRTVVQTEIEDSETIGFPEGVAASASGQEMYIADSALQAVHVVDAQTHVLQDSIPLNPNGDFGVASPGDLAVNQAGTEVYVTDSRSPRVFVVDLASHEVRELSLFESLLTPPAGLVPIQVMIDPDNSRAVYVLCQALNEVIKLDVDSGAILDFVRLRDPADPSSLWPAWSMALNPSTGEIYVVVNPGDLDFRDLLTVKSKIFMCPKDDLGNLAARRELLLTGSSIWELEFREDGLVYAVDSYRGEILVIDTATGTEMSRCAIPVEPGGRLLRADPAQNRLFVAGWLAGFVNIVE